MLCKECKKKSIGRGIKRVLCLNCKTDSFVNYTYMDLCSDCSEKLSKCQMCGCEIDKG